MWMEVNEVYRDVRRTKTRQSKYKNPLCLTSRQTRLMTRALDVLEEDDGVYTSLSKVKWSYRMWQLDVWLIWDLKLPERRLVLL